MSKNLFFFGVSMVFLLLVSACGASGGTIEVDFSKTVEEAGFVNEEGDAYETVFQDGTYVLSGVSVGDHIIPSHDVYAFSPEVIVVEETGITMTFEVTDDSGHSEKEGSTDSDEGNVDEADISEDEDGPGGQDESDTHDDDSDEEDSTESTRTVRVNDAQSFEEALLDDTVDTVVLDEDITGDFTMKTPMTIEFNAHILMGDLNIDIQEEGVIDLLDGSLDGSLSIDMPNASVNNHLDVFGQIVIVAVASNSYHDHHVDNLVFLEGDGISATFHHGAEGVFITGDDALVHMEPDALIGVLSIQNEAEATVITNAVNIQHAIVDNPSALFDGLPVNMSGSELPAFPSPIIETIQTEIDETFSAAVTLEEIGTSLPEEITVMTSEGPADVKVIWSLEGLDLDGENEQALFITGSFADLEDEELINAHYLQPFAQVLIEAPQPEEIILTSTILISSTIETSLEAVQTLEEVKALLPDNVITMYHDDGIASIRIDVEWTLDEGVFESESYDEQTLIFEGALTNIPEGYANPDDLKTHITVIIEPLEELVSDDPFYIGSNHPEGVDIDYAIEDFSTNQYVSVTITVDQEFVFSHYEDYYTGEIYEPFSGAKSLTFSEFYDGEVFHLKVVLSPVERPDTATLYGGGTGTEEDPFQIDNTTHLSNMRYYLDYGYHFKLTSDIHFAEGESFTPLRSQNDYPFNGVLDGDGHVISGYAVNDDTFVYDYEDTDGHFAFIRESEGTIKDLSFHDMQVSFGDTRVSSGVLVHLNRGTIRDVTIEGVITAHKAASFAHLNYGTIQNVSADVTMHEPYAGLVVTNFGTLKDASIEGTLHYTRRFASGSAGVVRTNVSHDGLGNTYPGLITNVNGNLTVHYDFDRTVTFDFAGFVNTSRSGTLIESSAITIDVINDGTHDPNLIAGFIIENMGTITNVQATGSIEGASVMGGFAYHNFASGTMTFITSDVDVYASQGSAAGFVYWNDKVFDTYGFIGDSTTSGDVYTDGSPRSDFIVQRDGNTDNITRNGEVFAYPQ